MSDTSQVHQHSSQQTHETPLLWTHVVNNKRKGNNKTQQSIVSFNPTLINRPVTDAESSQRSVNGAASPGPIAVIKPFLKGIEQDSVFIDLTPIKDRMLLNKALLKFNEASIADDMYEDFLGYRNKPRHYLGHAFLETMWLLNSAGRRTLIEDGITLDDGTFVKGFPSYPGDATIVRLTLQNLPFLPALQLKEEMADRLSCFGDVLDHGISRTNGIYQGEGYATLNLTVPSTPGYECQELHPDADKPCPGHRHLETLDRVMIWNPQESDQRLVLLHWDQMPKFCRICQKSDHCRADCPDYKKWLTCYHCNETGHEAKQCSRNDSPNKVRAVDNSSSKPRKGSQEAKGGASTGKKNGPKATSVAAAGGVPSKTQGGNHGGAGRSPPGSRRGSQAKSAAAAVQEADKNNNNAGQQGATEDQLMDEPTPNHDDEAKVMEASNDIDMYESTADSAGDGMVRPERPATKIFRPEGADDFSAAKQHAAATAASSQQHEVMNDQQAGLTSPPPSSHQ